MEQNTNEWLEMRKTKLGASDANIIMGKSRFKTPLELFNDKLGISTKKESDNTYVQDKGHRLETKTRAMIEIETDLEFPALIAVSEDYPFLMASLDGFNKEKNIVLECKYVGQDDFEAVKSGNILDHYKPQIMHQMLVTGAEKSILAVCTEDKTQEDKKALKYASVEVFPDKFYIMQELLPALKNFWHHVQTKTPLDLSVKDVVEQPELEDMLTRYKLILDESEEIESRLSKLKGEIFKACKHKKVSCNGVTVYEIQNKDSVKTDYELFCEESGLTIPEKYISSKKGVVVKKITFPKANK